MKSLMNMGWKAGLALFVALLSAGAAEAQTRARFDWFDYVGADPMYAQVGAGQYANPILAGFYPDPSITRAGEDYYLVNSTFSFFPGIPVWKSRDLVHWTQIGNAIDRPGMLDFTGLGVSRGVFAPAISFHDGVFYIANTCVDCGGNYVISARDPAGPWSDPIWTPDVGGIDASLFFDDDGAVYMLNNDAPVGTPRYSGHRAIWIRRVDPRSFQSISEASVLIDGGVRPQENPIWIEGPHLYKINGSYYLMAAEGGTEEGHSEVILRSPNVLGPYEPYAGNPILTQRTLDPARQFPVTSTGHADLIETSRGQWWAIFLGVRPYRGNDFNTGRETFLLPVEWRDGWPIILENGAAVPFTHAAPDLPRDQSPAPTSGNFTIRDEFNETVLGPEWLMVRNSSKTWAHTEDGALVLDARAVSIGAMGQPSFLARRQQHQFATVSTALQFSPSREGEEAGLVAFQNDNFFYALTLKRVNGHDVVEVRRRAGADDPVDGEVLVSTPASRGANNRPLFLRISARGPTYDFAYATREGAWHDLLTGADATVLSTKRAGGFVGAVIGMYAHVSENTN